MLQKDSFCAAKVAFFRLDARRNWLPRLGPDFWEVLFIDSHRQKLSGGASFGPKVWSVFIIIC
jgi:hypothetical protein